MSLFSSVLNAFSGDKAAKTQERAANAANNLVKEQYEQTRSDLMPFQQAGTSALSTYRDLLGQGGSDAANKAWDSYVKSPFLDRLLANTRDSVEASRAARGGLFSGATLQEIGDRTTDAYLADSGSFLDRISGLAASGQNAAAQTGTFGANAAGQRADLTNQAGAFKAQQAVIPALAYRQFMDDVKSVGGLFAGGAFGGK